VKNDDDEDSFSNYFKSHCHPECPDITVQQIEQKKTQFLAQVAEKFGLETVDPQSSTVKEVKTAHQLQHYSRSHNPIRLLVQ
jgi:dephospho-CoA kinase